MIGKYFLIALLCVSCAQVQGNELQEAIKNGLAKVRGMYEGGEKKVNSSMEAVTYKVKAVERKTMEFVIKANTMRDGTKQAVRDVARAMEEKAKELNKPQSVFECINKTEKEVNQIVKKINENFKGNLTTMEKSTIDKISLESGNLKKIRDALRGEYEKVVKTIQKCKTVSCVDNAVSGCGKWLEQMNSEIGNIFNRIGTLVGNYGKYCSEYFRAYSKQVVQIKTDGIRDIKKCVFP